MLLYDIILVDRQDKVVKRFVPTVKPEQMESHEEQLLRK